VGELYATDDTEYDIESSHYQSINFNPLGQKKSIKEVNVNEIKPVDYYTGHTHKDDEYFKTMKSRLQDRETSTNQFNSTQFREYRSGDTAGYGILDKVGIDMKNKLNINDSDSDLQKRYNKAIAERQNMSQGQGQGPRRI
jgi:hypothetical protein